MKGSSMTNPNDNQPNDPFESGDGASGGNGAGDGGYGEDYRSSGQEGYGQSGYDQSGSQGGSQGYGQGGYQEGYGQSGSQGGYQEGYGQGGYDQGGYGQSGVQGYGPGSYGAYGAQSAPGDGKPQNYMVPSIIATIGSFLFCCLLGLPAGIAAIVFGNKVDSLWNMGDYQGAQTASEKAKLWMIVAAVLAGVGLIANIIVFASGGYSASFDTY